MGRRVGKEKNEREILALYTLTKYPFVPRRHNDPETHRRRCLLEGGANRCHRKRQVHSEVQLCCRHDCREIDLLAVECPQGAAAAVVKSCAGLVTEPLGTVWERIGVGMANYDYCAKCKARS